MNIGEYVNQYNRLISQATKSIEPAFLKAFSSQEKLASAFSSYTSNLFKDSEAFYKLSSAFACLNPATAALETSAMSVIYSKALKQLSETAGITETLSRFAALSAMVNTPFIPDASSSEHRIQEDDFSDCVIVDESAARIIDLSETITLPIGNHRVKMKTSDFLTVLVILVNIVLFIFDHLPSSDSEKVSYLEKENKAVYEFIMCSDASNSSQMDYIDSLKEHMEENGSDQTNIQMF